MAYEDAQSPDSSNRTAFRAAEKKYQLQRDQRTKNGKKKQLLAAEAEADLLRDVLDFRADAACALESDACALSSDGVSYCQAWPGQHIYTLAAHPGLVVLPGALTAAEQRRIVRDALTAFPEPPNATTLRTWDHCPGCGRRPCGGAARRQTGSDASHAGEGPLVPACDAAHGTCNGSRLRELGQHCRRVTAVCGDGAATQTSSTQPPAREPGACPPCKDAAEAHWTAEGDGPSARELLRRLRWATLGPQYDWTRRRYGPAAAAPPLPRYLRDIAVRAAAAAARVTQDTAGSEGPCTVVADAAPAEYEPNAALVNYYGGEGDTLCGHQDDAEGALEQPLVSASVGCDAVFLIGGAHRDVPPTALLLRSGDVVVMAGAARTSYHGVPRVLLSRPAEELRSDDSTSANCRGSAVAEETVPLDAAMAEFISRARINVSIRQVTGCDTAYQDA